VYRNEPTEVGAARHFSIAAETVVIGSQAYRMVPK
jgi:hypothetical protein